MELAGSPDVFGTHNFFEAEKGVCQLTSSVVRLHAKEACLELGTAKGPNWLANNTYGCSPLENKEFWKFRFEV